MDERTVLVGSVLDTKDNNHARIKQQRKNTQLMTKNSFLSTPLFALVRRSLTLCDEHNLTAMARNRFRY